MESGDTAANGLSRRTLAPRTHAKQGPDGNPSCSSRGVGESQSETRDGAEDRNGAVTCDGADAHNGVEGRLVRQTEGLLRIRRRTQTTGTPASQGPDGIRKR